MEDIIQARVSAGVCHPTNTPADESHCQLWKWWCGLIFTVNCKHKLFLKCQRFISSSRCIRISSSVHLWRHFAFEIGLYTWLEILFDFQFFVSTAASNDFFHYWLTCLVFSQLIDKLFSLWNAHHQNPRWGLYKPQTQRYSIHNDIKQRKADNPHFWEAETQKYLIFSL